MTDQDDDYPIDDPDRNEQFSRANDESPIAAGFRRLGARARKLAKLQQAMERGQLPAVTQSYAGNFDHQHWLEVEAAEVAEQKRRVSQNPVPLRRTAGGAP